MYQRFGLVMVSVISAPDPQQQVDDDKDQLIGGEEEYRRQRDHDEDHGGGDRGFPARRPRDLRGLGANLLGEFEDVQCHRKIQIWFPPPNLKDDIRPRGSFLGMRAAAEVRYRAAGEAVT